MHALLARNLVDELHLLIDARILGNGKRLLLDGIHQTFALLSATPYPSGVVALYNARRR